MSLLGGSSSRSLLGGSSGGGNGGGGGPIINQLKTTILFKRDNTEIQKNLTIEQGTLTLNNQTENSFLLRNEDTVRTSIISNDRQTKLTYNVPEFSIKTADKNALTFDASGRAAFNKKVDNTDYHVDISGDLNFSGNLYQDGSNALFDLQNLFNYLTKPAPAFDLNEEIVDPNLDISSVRITSFDITIFWIRGENYKTNYQYSLEDKNLPYVDRIGVDVRDVSGVLNDWVDVTTSISAEDASYSFDIDQTFTDSSGNTLTIDKTVTFDLRVYPINSVSVDEPNNYLIFNDLFFASAGAPSAPRELKITLSFGTSFTLGFKKPQFNETNETEDPDKPPLAEYNIEYRPIESQRFPRVFNTDLVKVLKNGNNSTESYTIDDEEPGFTVFPGTTYDISLSARNNQSSVFGVVSGVSHETELPQNTDFKDVNLSGIVFTGWEPFKTVRIPGESFDSTINYFNTETGFPLQVRESNSIFVNYTKLGIASDQRERVEELASTEVFHIIGGEEFIDASISFYGYTTDISNEGKYDGSFNVSTYNSDISFVNVQNVDAVDEKHNTNPEFNGFGLQGVYGISIKDDLVGVGKLFEPSGSTYTIGYRNSGTNIDKLGTTNKTQNFEFYVDDLSGDPEIEVSRVDLANPSYVFNHGIPSIQSIDLLVEWKTSNNGNYFLPEGGSISSIEINDSSVNGLKNFENYNVNEIKDEYSHVFETVIHFTEFMDTDTLQDVVKIVSKNLIKSIEGVEEIVDILADQGVFYCDHNSFNTDTDSNAKITGLKLFGTDVYQYTNTDSGEQYTLTEYNQLEPVADNQLIFFEGKFVGVDYPLSPYRDINIFDNENEKGFREILYSSKSTTGNDVDDGPNVKWLVKKFANITVDGETQIKRLRITDNTGTHSRYADYPNKLFLIQFKHDDDPIKENRETGWLDLNIIFNPSNSNFMNDIGIQESGIPENLILKAELGITFDVYVRIGIPIDSGKYIENLTLEDV
jgi:hypothetical protein